MGRLAVRGRLRGRHLGARTVAAAEDEARRSGARATTLHAQADKQGFYERCGYKRNPFPHEHPAYHTGNEPHRLVIMSYPAILKQEEYESFKKYLDTRVMGQ